MKSRSPESFRGNPFSGRLLLILLLPFLGTLFCEGPPTEDDDDETFSSPKISSLYPESGPPSGGTEVTITGTGFLDGAGVMFGNAPSEDVTFSDGALLIAITPPSSPGIVDVAVENPDGGYATLPDAFVYYGLDTKIDWVALHWPSELHGEVGAITENIYCWVYEAGVTDVEGQGEGIVAGAGYGPEGTNPNFDPQWVWFEQIYNTDIGPDWAPIANDEYTGGVVPALEGTFDLACRFTIDGGLTYAFGDLNEESLTYDPAWAGKLYVN